MVVSTVDADLSSVRGFWRDHEVRDGLAGDEVEVRCVWAWFAVRV